MNNFDLSLYLVTNSDGFSEEEFINRVSAALRGGVTLVQLREKERCGGDYLRLATRLVKLCHSFSVPLIVDDRVDVAYLSGADGVHLGYDDLPIEEARRLLPKGKIIGATAKTVEKARAAIEAGADYLGVGAIYPTTTKVKTKLTSVQTLREIRALEIPCVAIGGLCCENMELLRGSGADGVAVVSAIMKSADPERAAAELLLKEREILCTKSLR